MQTSNRTYADHWTQAAKTRADRGILDDMVASELFDHSWMAALHQLDRRLEFSAGDRVMDAGCGWGRLLLGVSHFHPQVMVDGYELTEEFVTKARDLIDRYGVGDRARVIHGDLLEVDLPAAHYDSLYCSRVLHYIDDKELVIQRFHATLKPGGRAMVMIPNRSNPYQRVAYKHAPLFPIREVGRMMAAAGFSDLKYGGYRVLPAGRRFSHDGVASRVEKAVSTTPLGRLAGLAYVVGQK